MIRLFPDIKIGGFELLYLVSGLEGFQKETKFGFGWCLRHWYFFCQWRIKGKYANFVLGWCREQHRFVWGLNH